MAAELQIPLVQLRSAAPSLFPSKSSDLGDVKLSDVVAYARTRLCAEGREHERFETVIEGARVQRVEEGDVLVLQARLHSSRKDGARWLELHDDLVLEHLVTHSIYVFLRRDLRAGELGEGAPTLLGDTHYQKRALVVDRTAGSPFGIVRSAFGLGLHHIEEGTDHVLFLLMLLLPAPLLVPAGVRPRRWKEHGAVRKAARHTLAIATAFTIGHSLTLVITTLLRIEAGPRVTAAVEVLIAVSILVSAVHALRPLFPAREVFVAGVFGLVHGLAFASALASFGIDSPTLALSLLGFNLGVEAMQVAIILGTVPLLTVLSRGPSYGIVRVAAASFGVLASLGWIAERTTSVRVPTATWAEALAHRAPWVVGALFVMVLIDVSLRHRDSHRTERTTT